MKTIIWYMLMLSFLGATIGAIVALSKTSVSNTLLQVIVTFIGGTAGLYFLERTKQHDSFTSLISYNGILFLLSFWVSYGIVAQVPKSKKIYYDWNDEQTIVANLIQAEMEKHLEQLGIDPKRARDILNVDMLSHSQPNQNIVAQCLQSGNPANQFTLNILNLYDEIRNCDSVIPSARGVGEYLSYLAQVAENDNTKIPQMFYVLSAIFKVTPNAVLPNIQKCNMDAKKLKTMNLLKERLHLCQQNSQNYMLHLVRTHASSYYKIWQKNPQIEKERLFPLMESLPNGK